jgi:hypothetical protein
MKAFKLVGAKLVIAAFFLVAGAVRLDAQGVGLLPTETSETREQEWMDITAGAVIGKEQSFYGARDTFDIVPEVRLFVDLGILNLNKEGEPSSTDIGAQAGVVFAEPFDLIFDNALRFSLYGATGDRHTLIGGTLALMGSYQPIQKGVTFYGGLGIELQSDNRHGDVTTNESVTAGTVLPVTTERRSDTVTKLNPFVDVGALMPVADHVNLFAEWAYTDNWWVSLGLRVR